MLLADLVTASAAVGATSARGGKVAALAALLRATAHTDPELLGSVAAYLSGVLPQRRIGLGWHALSSMPAPASSASLSLSAVEECFNRLARLSGAGAAAARLDLSRQLFAQATEPEQRFLRGLIGGDLRQGALDGILLKAIAEAAQVPELAVRRAAMLAGHVAVVAEAALCGGLPELNAIGLEVGRPIRPMLAATAPDVPSAFQNATNSAMTDIALSGSVAVEAKLDGIRIQVHRSDNEVRVFTRSLDDITPRVPEVVELVLALPLNKAVFDGEAIALRPDGRPHPFQVTGARTASSTDPGELRRATPLTAYLFDVLHLNGQDLLDEPAEERFVALAEVVAAQTMVPRLVTTDLSVAQRFLDELVAAGHEGIVVKSLRAPYAAGRRGAGWIKVKPRHTLDLVVVGVEWGSGRRAGLLSNIHLGARDPVTGGFIMLGKTFKGMTDQMLAWQTARFLDLETGRQGHVVWVRPEQVVEIAFDGLHASTRYPAGLALRFARVVRYRSDKTAQEADTVDTVRAMYTRAHGLDDTTNTDEVGR